MVWSLRVGDAGRLLGQIESETVHTCITSPPYFGLRDYGVEGQIGLERTPTEYVSNLVSVFEQVRHVLRDDGTLWIVVGDSYSRHGGRANGQALSDRTDVHRTAIRYAYGADRMKIKDLMGIPWMLAFALRGAGWYLRQEIIWAKGISGPTYRGGSCMPESVKDRCTRSHETVFMLSKSPRYYFDTDAIREPHTTKVQKRNTSKAASDAGTIHGHRKPSMSYRYDGVVPGNPKGRNRRSVWHVNPRPFKAAHFATFPSDLIEPMVLAGAPPGGLVLDPFAGAGTTGVVAIENGRSFLGVELNPEYTNEIARPRLIEAWRGQSEKERDEQG